MAARFLVSGGTGNWNSTTNWSATDGGASGASFPVNGDAVHLTTLSANANLTINVASACTTFSVEGTYAGTLTFSNNLTVAGAVTLLSTMSIAGTSDLICITTATITSGGKTLTGGLRFGGTSQTFTLGDNWTINGTLVFNGTTAITVNSNTINVGGGLTNSTATSGTTNIVLNGTGTVNILAAVLKNNLTINTSGTITFAATSQQYNTGTLTYTAGTVVTTGSTLVIAAATTLNTAGITWNNITLSYSGTLTVNSLLSATGTLTLNQGNNAFTFGGTAGFTIDTLSAPQTAGATITLLNSVTYTITSSFQCSTARTGSPVVFTSDHATNKTTLTLYQGATCNVAANFTRVDSSAGRSIQSFNGTITSCINIFAYTDVPEYPPTLNRAMRGRRSPLYNRAKSVRYAA